MFKYEHMFKLSLQYLYSCGLTGLVIFYQRTCYARKDYVVIIGSANIDVAGYSHESLNYADSNPGKIKFTPGGVGRNIAQNLALLGNKAWLLSAVGSDFMVNRC